MKVIIETERLMLRELIPEDALSFYELNANQKVLRYTGDLPFNSVLEASLFLENYTDYQDNGFGRWAVIEKVNNRFLGWCGLKLNEENLIDLGFLFYQNEWGKGYATEASKSVIEYGFNQLSISEIIARVASKNHASIRVIEKLGMVYWKRAACDGIADSLYYKLQNK